MNKHDFFPLKPNINPTIYAYKLDAVNDHQGLIKVGYTDRDVRTRIKEQLGTAGIEYTILLEESAMRHDGSSFTDHDIHRTLRRKGFANPHGEWFKCSVEDVKAALLAIRTGIDNEENRTLNFSMRPEQVEAVERTADYFARYKREEGNNRPPRFLWNAKMRFGKTFTAYQLAIKKGWTKLLVLTFKPAVQSAWEEDLMQHVDFEGWQFIARDGKSIEEIDESKPYVCFGSFQDFLGKNKAGGIKAKNEWVHLKNWDCVILDEYHFGAWRDGAQELFAAEDRNEQNYAMGDGLDYYDEDLLPITTNHFLYLSGTPFRAIATGEFIEEQIYNWTYSDEQSAKENYKGEPNPYASLPRIVMLTYQLPEAIIDIANQGEFDEFDLNTFFKAEGEETEAEFRYQDEVQKWLDLIRGAFKETAIDNLKLGAQKPPFPYSDDRLLSMLNHTVWFLPSVSACDAMANLIQKPNNTFYQDYKVVVAAGSKAGIGADALPPVLESIGDNPLKSKTITLTCGKLTTGVTVKPWAGIFMLRNSSSPETYFQAAFRIQSPWVVKNPDNKNPNKETIVKQECYIFDFAPNRALRQIADYSCKLNVDEDNPEKKVSDFISFLPVLAYDGSHMKQIDAAGVLDIAMSGTSATLLARRWESALLVNVDDMTLSRLMNSPKAMDALMQIEGFRSLNQDLETIINKSKSIKNIKQKANEEELTTKEKRQLTKEEKEYKSMRKQVQEKLIKFATRIPIFMYLTDYRERCLKDVITQLEPGLFKKVTGLDVKDFELLVSLNVFNGPLMNDAVYKFKRYEDASLEYAGITKHEEQDVGGFDTVISRQDYNQIFVNQSNL